METAQGQGRSLMMNMFMMWMAGNSIHIFPIMMVGMAAWTPINALLQMKTGHQHHSLHTRVLISRSLQCSIRQVRRSWGQFNSGQICVFRDQCGGSAGGHVQVCKSRLIANEGGDVYPLASTQFVHLSFYIACRLTG